MVGCRLEKVVNKQRVISQLLRCVSQEGAIEMKAERKQVSINGYFSGCF